MSVILEKQFSYFFTTANSNNDPSVRVSSDGSRMDITLDEPIYINSSSLHTTLCIESASIWNDTPNIAAQYHNNTLTYLINGIIQPNITFGDGQYSLSNINQIISNLLTNRGESGLAIRFASDNATDTAILVLDKGYQIDTAGTNSICSIL